MPLVIADTIASQPKASIRPNVNLDIELQNVVLFK